MAFVLLISRCGDSRRGGKAANSRGLCLAGQAGSVAELLSFPSRTPVSRAAIDDLMSPRAPQPTLDAVYLLTPTTQSVERVIADFADGRRTYRSVHLYFVDGEFRLCFSHSATTAY